MSDEEFLIVQVWVNDILTLPQKTNDTARQSHSTFNGRKIPVKKWGDTEIAERGRSVLVMHARYRSAGLNPHQRGWMDTG